MRSSTSSSLTSGIEPSYLPEKVSSDLLEIIRGRPTVIAELLRAVRAMPAKEVSAMSRQIRDGDW